MKPIILNQTTVNLIHELNDSLKLILQDEAAFRDEVIFIDSPGTSIQEDAYIKIRDETKRIILRRIASIAAPISYSIQEAKKPRRKTRLDLEIEENTKRLAAMELASKKTVIHPPLKSKNEQSKTTND